MFKIIDNLIPLRMVAAIDLSALARPLAAGDTITVRFRNRDLGPAACESVWTGNGHQTAMLQLKGFDEQLIDARRIEVDCIIETYQGLIIPEKSLIKETGGYAVYRLGQERFELVNLKVTNIFNGQAVVQGLAEGDVVTTTPGLVSAGMKYR